MPLYSPALDLIINRGDKSASGLLSLLGSRVVSSSQSGSGPRIINGDQGNCRIRLCTPNLTGERAFDDVDLSTATVRVALGIPGQSPFCLATIATPLPTAAAYVTTRQSATVDLPATKRITLDPAPCGGSLIVTLDSNAPFEIPFDAEAAQIQALAGPSYVAKKRGSNIWEISGTAPDQDVTIALDVSNLLVPIGVTGRLVLNTNELAAAFTAAGNPKFLRLTREIQVQFPGDAAPQIIFQGSIEVARALLDLSSLVPVPLLPSDVASLTTLIGTKQPISSELTALAALSATAWGRLLLTKADAGAFRTYASVQPLNSALTAISALATSSYGRGLLTQANPAALRTYIDGDSRWAQLSDLATLGLTTAGQITAPVINLTRLNVDRVSAGTFLRINRGSNLNENWISMGPDADTFTGFLAFFDRGPYPVWDTADSRAILLQANPATAEKPYSPASFFMRGQWYNPATGLSELKGFEWCAKIMADGSLEKWLELPEGGGDFLRLRRGPGGTAQVCTGNQPGAVFDFMAEDGSSGFTRKARFNTRGFNFDQVVGYTALGAAQTDRLYVGGTGGLSNATNSHWKIARNHDNIDLLDLDGLGNLTLLGTFVSSVMGADHLYFRPGSAAQNNSLSMGANGTLAAAQASTYDIVRAFDGVVVQRLYGNGDLVVGDANTSTGRVSGVLGLKLSPWPDFFVPPYTIYHSTDSGKASYKDAAGTVHALYA